jgi:cytochrome c biogenesis protein CcdA
VTLELTAIPLAFIAGIVGVMSPCVWPLVPVVMAASTTSGRSGPVYLAGGLAASFAVAGTFLTFVLVSMGLDPEFFRYVAAVLLVAMGLLLIVDRLGERSSLALSRLASGFAVGRGARGRGVGGAVGQFGVGALLGVVWLPCVGPTLGIAIALAALGENLLGSFSVMLAYGLGTAGVLLAVGLLSGRFLVKRGATGFRAGAIGRKVLGWSVLVLGVLVLTKMDKILEALAVDLLPSWVYML